MVIRIEGRNLEEDMKKLRAFMEENNIYYDEFTSAYQAVALEEIEATIPSYQEEYKINNDEAHMLTQEIAEAFHDSHAWNNVLGDLATEADIYTKEYLNKED